MRENRSLSRKSPFSIGMRFVFVGCALAASAALAVGLLVHAHSAAYADPALIQTTVPAFNTSFGADPWDIKFNNGHAWVAEPQCDVNVTSFPVCGIAHQSGILEYAASGFANGAQPLNKLAEPAGYSSPFFLAFDGSGNLWFSEPITNSIGEYDTGGNWHQWSVPTAGASPFDLTFDQYGHLWFTELSANKIGEFNPGSQSFNEYAPPTPNSRPYGITGPDPTTHSIWFTENNNSVHRIGQIIPNPDGTIQGGQIQEYLTNSSSSGGITPHLITYDQNGNIWWSEGYDGSIGKLVISQAASGTSNGVTEYVVPPPTCPPASNCSSHISGISVDGNGTVWFDDALSSRYGSFNPSSSQFTMFIVGGSVTSNAHPHDGLVVDCNNNVWFNQEFSNTLTEAQVGTGTNPACGSQPPGPNPTPSPSPTVTPPPPLQSGPVNKQWYFAEGRVGAGFTEYLSLDNPTGTPCTVNITYLYTPDGHGPLTRTLSVSIPASTRTEESVDRDLGTSPTGFGITDSAIVTVDNAATPACPGIVAERPMYFNALGTNSTSDVPGVTHLGTTFYFADVAVGSQSGGTYSSFLTILNPPGSPSASVTATYYAGGAAVGSDTANVAGGTRGTIFPNNHRPALPAHVSVVVTSSVPVALERPTYFSHVNEGQAGVVSGGADVIGVQSLASDWLFAEGYTGGQFQEQFVIANLDPSHATASVKIQLELSGGPANPATITVAPMSQVIWNVNLAAPNQNVSAEITSSGAQVVVEREMFFRYNHDNRSNGRNLQATGGTDVLGQIGPGNQSIYSFAEGYVNVGYDEWLTLQNPTQATETIWITLNNAMGHTYSFPVTILKQSRYTVDIVAVVLANLYHNGDGFRGFEVSMTVQTTSNAGGPFVAERPMYSNVNGTQGGTDIIGYTGG